MLVEPTSKLFGGMLRPFIYRNETMSFDHVMGRRFGSLLTLIKGPFLSHRRGEGESVVIQGIIENTFEVFGKALPQRRRSNYDSIFLYA